MITAKKVSFYNLGLKEVNDYWTINEEWNGCVKLVNQDGKYLIAAIKEKNIITQYGDMKIIFLHGSIEVNEDIEKIFKKKEKRSRSDDVSGDGE